MGVASGANLPSSDFSVFNTQSGTERRARTGVKRFKEEGKEERGSKRERR